MASSSKIPNQSGRETLEYRKVQVNAPMIISTLKERKEAKNELCRCFEQKGWISDTTEPPADELMVMVVLNKIELSADAYSEFMRMLGNIPPLDVIKKRINTTTCKRSIMAACMVYPLVYVVYPPLSFSFSCMSRKTFTKARKCSSGTRCWP